MELPLFLTLKYDLFIEKNRLFDLSIDYDCKKVGLLFGD